MTRSPYSGLPSRAFWRGAVAGASPFPSDIYVPKFGISPETRIFTAGSCFAQYVGAALKRAKIGVIDAEPVPRGMPEQTARAFGYGLYSARFGNIYTLRQFRQLVEEVAGLVTPAEPVWEKNGRFWDAQRPGVEPGGLATASDVSEMRSAHLTAVGQALQSAEVIVFTLGLTEAWEHRESGTVYPTAPGTIAGSYDPDVFGFINFSVAEILADFHALDAALLDLNPDMKWILTVSPVPLAATATPHHVLPATIRSKAVLRVVCDDLAQGSDRIDYFPSYELVTSPAHTQSPFASDLRTVRPEIVEDIMGTFLMAHGLKKRSATAPGPEPVPDTEDDAICEDILLDAFRPTDPVP